MGNHQKCGSGRGAFTWWVEKQLAFELNFGSGSKSEGAGSGTETQPHIRGNNRNFLSKGVKTYGRTDRPSPRDTKSNTILELGYRLD